jgi:hypothetical protein
MRSRFTAAAEGLLRNGHRHVAAATEEAGCDDEVTGGAAEEVAGTRATLRTEAALDSPGLMTIGVDIGPPSVTGSIKSFGNY